MGKRREGGDGVKHEMSVGVAGRTYNQSFLLNNRTVVSRKVLLECQIRLNEKNMLRL